MAPGNNWIRRAIGDSAVPRRPRLKLLRIGPPRSWLTRTLQSVVNTGRVGRSPSVPTVRPLDR
jgi:hypothetical protein